MGEKKDRKRRSGWTPVEEVLREIKNDSQAQSNIREAERRAAEVRRQREIEERPIVEALRCCGVRIKSTQDFYAVQVSGERALREVVRLLSLPFSERAREGLTRALGTSRASKIRPEILLLLETEIENGNSLGPVAFGLGVALARSTHTTERLSVMDLLRDPRFGAARLAFAEAVKDWKLPGWKLLLTELKNDPVVGEEARRLLRSGPCAGP